MKKSLLRPKMTTGASAGSDSSIIKTKIENVTEGLSSDCFNLLYNRVLPASKGRENALTICDYICSLKSEINLSDNYRKNNIEAELYLNQELHYTFMNNAQKSILLTGATGNIGTKVVKLLFTIPDGNVTVKAAVRSLTQLDICLAY